ncbi:hypothetical protein D3C78_1902530 [compost metagenome]
MYSAVRPASRSGWAADEPLYGTSSMGAPLAMRNISAAISWALPRPDVATLASLGLAFIQATNSGSVLAGICG